MNANTQSGFTLWELLMTVLVAGVVLGLGVPNFLEFQRNNAMTAAANEFVTAILLARAEAVKRQVPVTLCASADPVGAPACSINGAGTNGGFIVWVDENGNTDANGSPIVTDATDGNAVLDGGEQILLQRAAPGGAINIWAESGYIAYGPNGFARRAQGAAVPQLTRILLCDDRGNRPTAAGSAGRVVRVEPTGRGQVQREQIDVVQAVALITAAGVPAVCP
jgi:type IV fimbrial biogenesis protein FimT